MQKTLKSGEILGRLRKAYGIPQAQLAEELDVSRQYLSAVENGREPGIELLRAAAERFQLPVAIFYLGEDDGSDTVTRSFRQILDSVLTAAEKQPR